MNISDQEFNAVIDDVLKALKSNGIGEQENNEVLAILWSMKGEIVGV
jgi:hemoglobin